jgi:dolichyl-phosphate beta-glucosyltransferase
MMLGNMTSLSGIELSIIIPAFNEEARIESSLEKIRSYCLAKHPSHEVLVINDGSEDRTSAIVQHWADLWPNLQILQYPKNRGKGYATKAGVLTAKGQWILCSDADLSTPIEELDRLLAFAHLYDVVIGSRSIDGSHIERKQPWHRVFMGRFFNWAVRTVLVGGHKDTQCGFKLYHRRAAETLFERMITDGFAFDAEILFLAKRLGLKVGEVPVSWKNDNRSKVRLLQDPPLMFLDLFRIRWIHRKMKKQIP